MRICVTSQRAKPCRLHCTMMDLTTYQDCFTLIFKPLHVLERGGRGAERDFFKARLGVRESLMAPRTQVAKGLCRLLGRSLRLIPRHCVSTCTLREHMCMWLVRPPLAHHRPCCQNQLRLSRCALTGTCCMKALAEHYKHALVAHGSRMRVEEPRQLGTLGPSFRV